MIAGCSGNGNDAAPEPAEPAVDDAPAAAAAPAIEAISRHEKELPTWKIPNIPKAAEAYYAPDNLHVIAQTQDPRCAGRRGP